jgi:hypothetical protein
MHTHNPLSGHGSYHEEEEDDDIDDGVSDLTFDQSVFDTTIFTQTPLQRDIEQQHQYAEGEVQLSERNVRRFGARKGYAPALNEEEDSESAASGISRSHNSTSNTSNVSHMTPYTHNATRPPPLSRKEIMTRDFSRRVQEASSFKSRFYTLSTLIMAAQIVMMALMIKQGGVLPLAENFMLGPSVFVMLDYGAQQGGYIIYEGQWWRLVSAMFVHAGMIHLACNVYVQVSVSVSCCDFVS